MGPESGSRCPQRRFWFSVGATNRSSGVSGRTSCSPFSSNVAPPIGMKNSLELQAGSVEFGRHLNGVWSGSMEMEDYFIAPSILFAS
jgi:hypothetical protein